MYTNNIIDLEFKSHPKINLGYDQISNNKISECQGSEMKSKLIEIFQFKHIETTKYNEVWQNDSYTMIWNKVGDFAKIKLRNINSK
ncbi:MAG: hypothetical protein VB024_04505 [Dysgonamonadaceae bacterium]|nr:hypothetical protein [Dysgonamonadaceae bacterium]